MSIREDELNEVLFTAIQSQIQIAADLQEVIKRLNAEPEYRRQRSDAASKLEAARRTLKRSQSLYDSLYQNYVEQLMIADAVDGKVDLILTKSISRFGGNIVDILDNLRTLSAPTQDMLLKYSLDLSYIQTGSYHTAFIIFSTSFFLDSHITLSSYLSKILLISFRFLS